MDRNAVWNLFEKTGNINAYMLYHDINEGGCSDSREANLNATQDRRADYKKSECR